MTSVDRVTQIERKVRQIERDLTKIRFSLKRVKQKNKQPKLASVQESIERDLVDDQDPVAVIQEMRRRKTK